tara:strand:- start:1254 stop:1514 length:261 start_codon:yes stop_codon:yes gene_type:complete
MTNPMRVWWEKERNRADFWKEKALNMVEKSTYLELEKFLLDEQSRLFERIRVLEDINSEQDAEIDKLLLQLSNEKSKNKMKWKDIK